MEEFVLLAGPPPKELFAEEELPNEDEELLEESPAEVPATLLVVEESTAKELPENASRAAKLRNVIFLFINLLLKLSALTDILYEFRTFICKYEACAPLCISFPVIYGFQNSCQKNRRYLRAAESLYILLIGR